MAMRGVGKQTRATYNAGEIENSLEPSILRPRKSVACFRARSTSPRRLLVARHLTTRAPHEGWMRPHLDILAEGASMFILLVDRAAVGGVEGPGQERNGDEV